MFLKPYKIKSNVPLKSSEVKSLRQRIESTFPNLNSEELITLFPQKSLNVTLLKLITNGGFQTSVFCIDKLPMFFEYETNDDTILLAPALYALWRIPSLLPYFTTMPAVLPKLLNGADLFLPGVEPQGTGMNIYGHYKRGQLVAINLTSNKSAVGVGFLIRSSYDLYMCGGHGTAVKVLHIFGDKLWGHEPTLAQQIPSFKKIALTYDDFPALGSETQKSKNESVSPQNLVNNVVPDTSSKLVESTTEQEEIIDKIDQIVLDENSGETHDSPEELLKGAFLTALKIHGKSLQLPLLTSNFYRLCVVTEATQPIDLKKTKYKKLSNFLNEMVAQGFIIMREEAKGIDKITKINFEHPELVNFIVDVKTSSVSADDAEKDHPLFHSELMEMYIVTDETAPFFTKLNFKRGESIPATQIKKIVREYVNKNNFPIIDPVNKLLQLDETLQRICECTQASLSKIATMVINKMDHQYQMCNVKDVSSNKPPIQLSIATRSGNKKVTLVTNIEYYGIIVNEFLKLCKQGAAASTTIVKIPNQKREQLQIQGNQIRFVFNLLTETYKVPAKCILGLELAKDTKKHKKK